MDCPDVERMVLAGEPVSGPEAEAHLAGCESCRFLVGDGAPVAQLLAGSAGRPAPDLQLLEAAVMGSVRRERGVIASLRALPQLARFGILVATMAAVLGVYFFFMRSWDWADHPAQVIYTFGGMGGYMLLLGWMLMRPLYRPPLPPWVSWALVGGGLLLPVLLAVLPLAPKGTEDDFPYVLSGYSCFAFGTVISLVVFLAARFLDRGGRSSLGVPFAAVAAGLCGAIGLQIGCSENYPLHLLTGHALVPVAMLVGSWLFKKAQA
jgi:hypothetical protein